MAVQHRGKRRPQRGSTLLDTVCSTQRIVDIELCVHHTRSKSYVWHVDNYDVSDSRAVGCAAAERVCKFTNADHRNHDQPAEFRIICDWIYGKRVKLR